MTPTDPRHGKTGPGRLKIQLRHPRHMNPTKVMELRFLHAWAVFSRPRLSQRLHAASTRQTRRDLAEKDDIWARARGRLAASVNGPR
jgi:hypothetical protein